jgi:large subunit ribosomal protein L28
MPRRCQITGKKVSSGHNVSHSNIKTKRTFDPNLQTVSLYSEALGRPVSMRVSTRALRTVTKSGGIDAYLRRTDDTRLAPEARNLKRRVLRALR